MIKKMLTWIFFFLSVWCLASVVVSAQDIESLLDLDQEYKDVQDMLNASDRGGFSFKELVDSMVADGGSSSIIGPVKAVGEGLFAGIKEEFEAGRANMVFLLATGIAGGMLSAMSGVFAGGQAKTTGFYILYLMIFSVLSVTFMQLSQVAQEVFAGLLEFVKVLLPVYFLAIAFCSGAHTSFVFYETIVLVITLLELFILDIVLPAVRVYFVLGMVQRLSDRPYLSRFLNLLEKLIRGSVKTVFFIVMSIQAIEGLLAPFADAAAKSVVLKAASFIPGLGSGAAGMAEAILKSGMLLKNAIGIAGIFGIVLLCAYPVGKLMFYTILYHVSCVLTEAVADSRILSCIECSAKAAGLFLYIVCAGILLFLITIGITLASTNVV